MKRRVGELSKQERIDTLDALYTAASALKGREAMKLFLRDLLTESERIMLGRRILIARMLLAGMAATHITEKLRVGSDTVWRIERWLRDQFPGFENAIEELEKQMAERKKKYQKVDPFSFVALKRKYPLHFLLFNIADEIKATRKRRGKKN